MNNKFLYFTGTCFSRYRIKEKANVIQSYSSKITGRKMSPNNLNAEVGKPNAHIVVEIIEHLANAVVIKTIIRKSTGNISIMSFDSGEGLAGEKSPFDTFAQIIGGEAEILIDKVCDIPDTAWVS